MIYFLWFIFTACAILLADKEINNIQRQTTSFGWGVVLYCLKLTLVVFTLFATGVMYSFSLPASNLVFDTILINSFLVFFALVPILSFGVALLAHRAQGHSFFKHS